MTFNAAVMITVSGSLRVPMDEVRTFLRSAPDLLAELRACEYSSMMTVEAFNPSLVRALAARHSMKLSCPSPSHLMSSRLKTGNEILTIARQRLMSSGIAHASKLKKGIRLRVYPRGGGFMITVKPHGKQGYHVNRFGLEKPVLMWAEEGTKERMIRHLMSDGKHVVRIEGRYRRVGAFTGKMPAYHFLDGVYEQGVQILNRDIPSNLENSVMRKAGRLGWT